MFEFNNCDYWFMAFDFSNQRYEKHYLYIYGVCSFGIFYIAFRFAAMIWFICNGTNESVATKKLLSTGKLNANPTIFSL